MAGIDAERIHRAESILQVTYNANNDYGRQLAIYEVDREAFDNWLARRTGAIKTAYRNAWGAMDPALEPAINTLIMHAFLVGVVAGGSVAREVT